MLDWLFKKNPAEKQYNEQEEVNKQLLFIRDTKIPSKKQQQKLGFELFPVYYLGEHVAYVFTGSWGEASKYCSFVSEGCPFTHVKIDGEMISLGETCYTLEGETKSIPYYKSKKRVIDNRTEQSGMYDKKYNAVMNKLRSM